MVKITPLLKRGVLFGFRIKGHAMYAEEGKDIVCAAVSTITINTMKSIETLLCRELELEDKSGFIEFKIKGMPYESAGLLLNSAMLGYSSLAEQYKEYVLMKEGEEID